MDRKHRRRFSLEFKIEAVRLACQEGVPLPQVARDLGVGEPLLQIRIGGDMPGQHHDGNRPIQTGVTHLVALAHPPAAEWALDLAQAERGAGL